MCRRSDRASQYDFPHPLALHSNGFLCRCVSMCPFKWSCLLKALLQTLHTYFLSSLCVNLCLASADAFPNTFPQVIHCWGPCLLGDIAFATGFDRLDIFNLLKSADLTSSELPTVSDSLTGMPMLFELSLTRKDSAVVLAVKVCGDSVRSWPLSESKSSKPGESVL